MSSKLAKMADLRRFVHVSNGCFSLKKTRAKSPKCEQSSNVPAWEQKFDHIVEWNDSAAEEAFRKAKLRSNVPAWEQKFDHIVEWNDSAAEEAFRKAKLRHWSEINGEPCQIPLPNPDMYIDKIDWNLETV
ncbi:hypothetical protein Pint_30982 [Pistacia integerrima]|uniref:Uncharacterized protein n=1 Tax=Pistacia integerrima TaxID=434235 RepID=A0ACC0XLD6_9ROSI|nr:hypothetical protein Pint_30982 [Pistacia integerrima]